MASFSNRQGIELEATGPLVANDAPPPFRVGVVQRARDVGVSLDDIREIVCGELLVEVDTNNWSSAPVLGEIQRHLRDCVWHQVFDIAEAIYRHESHANNVRRVREYAKELNTLLRGLGLAWSFEGGEFKAKFSDAVENEIEKAELALSDVNMTESSRAMNVARKALSQRPDPNLTLAVHQSVAALEFVTKSLAGLNSKTLGEVLKAQSICDQIGLRGDLRKALQGVWGFASAKGRHINEESIPTRAEAELIAGIAAAVTTFLLATCPAREQRDIRRNDVPF